MKKILKQIVITILTWESRFILHKFKPKIVGVTGSVGKTSTKDTIYTVLKESFSVRKSEKSYNSEFGVPLTIIGCASAWNNLIGWIKNILTGLYIIMFERDYPKWLVLEIGADRPGDIRKVVKWIKFDVAVVTRLPDIPVHVEFFPNKEAVIAEKKYLPKSIGRGGVVILNIDDSNIVEIKRELEERPVINQPKIITFTLKEGAEADLKASNIHITYTEKNGCRLPDGITFKLDYAGNSVPVKMRGALGHHQIYHALAALATGLSQNVNMVSMIEALASHEAPPGRLRVIEGIKNSVILDDTYNSSPAAVEAALETLKEVEVCGRRIAVLGDMLELGGYTIDVHKQAGAFAAEICDILITVGLRAKFFAEGALENGMGKDKIFMFDDAESAKMKVQELIKSGDTILVKGSQLMRMEKIVEEIMLHPEEKDKLLVRQDEEWKRR